MQASVYHILPSTTIYLPTYPPENNFAAESEKDWKAARDYQLALATETPTETAYRYFAKYPNYPPDRFYTSTRQRLASANKALRPTGWATKLFNQLGYPQRPAYFYTLAVANLGLPIDYADPHFMYYSVVIAEIKAAIAKHIPQPYYWKIEVGIDGAVHVHVIGPHAPALAHLAHPQSKRVQAIQPGTEVRLLAYLSKPVAAFTAQNYGIYLQAKATKQTKALPNLSGQLGIKKSQVKK
jgi:hypothetical protein